MINFLTKFEKWTNLDKFENIFFIASNEQWKNLIKNAKNGKLC